MASSDLIMSQRTDRYVSPRPIALLCCPSVNLYLRVNPELFPLEHASEDEIVSASSPATDIHKQCTSQSPTPAVILMMYYREEDVSQGAGSNMWVSWLREPRSICPVLQDDDMSTQVALGGHTIVLCVAFLDYHGNGIVASCYYH